jgi:3-keto-5-aminohexanoate cleavage enzyme
MWLHILNLNPRMLKIEKEGINVTDGVFDYRNPHEWSRLTASSDLPPLIITAAITGGVHGKELNPNLPETIDEQVEQACACYREGASMVHIHARDPNNYAIGTGDAGLYRQLFERIRAQCPGIILNLTTGGSYGQPLEERLKCLTAGPDVATLALGPEMYRVRIKARKAPLPHPHEEIKLDDCSYITYSEVETIAAMTAELGIKPELEVFHQGQFWMVNNLIEKGLVSAPYLLQLVLGSISAAYATPWNMLALVNELPTGSLLFVAGLGPYQLPMLMMSIILGGHVRVGMEDNVYYKRGRLLTSNEEAVRRVARLAADMNRDIATPNLARVMLGLPPTQVD